MLEAEAPKAYAALYFHTEGTLGQGKTLPDGGRNALPLLRDAYQEAHDRGK